jgi:GNAT superfamily N-acetyltransferase
MSAGPSAELNVRIAELELRPARPSDADDIALSHRDSIRSIGPRFYEPKVVDDWEEGLTAATYLSAMAAGEVFFVATGRVDDTRLVLGFASDYRIEGRKHGASVYVRGVAARKGIGTSLFRLAEAHARSMGATLIQVEASLAAVAFYAVNGFVEVGRGETHLTSGRAIGCAFMVKDLVPAPHG